MESREIVNMILAAFSESRVLSIFRYGSGSGRDVDVFVLLRGDAPYIKLDKGVYDITAIGSTWEPVLVNNRDPLIVEPVFGGKELYGSAAFDLKTRISVFPPDLDCPDYLRQCSSLFFSWAVFHERGGNFRVALETLRFAASYALIADHYAAGNELFLFSDLLEENPFFSALNRSIKFAPAYAAKHFLNEVRSLLTECEVVV